MKSNHDDIGHHFLILIPCGIGDAVAVGLSIIDQIIQNDPQAYGKIDMVCTALQAEIFEADPRIRKCILVTSTIFPKPDLRTWRKGLLVDGEARALLRSINERKYVAVFPGSTTPFFHQHIHSPVIHISNLQLLKDALALRRNTELPYSKAARQIINDHFGNTIPDPKIGEEIPLYLTSQVLAKAMYAVRFMQARADVPECQLMVVAPDTSSMITRPPTYLLATGIANALSIKPLLIVCILPGYTDPRAASNLYTALTPNFGSRIFLLPPEPRRSLLEITALIDQADVFITGDTGLMHLAVTHKKLKENEKSNQSSGALSQNLSGAASIMKREREYCNACSCIAPLVGDCTRKAGKIIALFGGTNPHLFGYSQQSIILGRGRQEQNHFIPGILKEAYYRKRTDWFDHITPQQLTEAIVGLQECENAHPLPINEPATS